MYKEKMMLKYLATLLIIILILVMTGLMGCGGETPKSTSVSPPSVVPGPSKSTTVPGQTNASLPGTASGGVVGSGVLRGESWLLGTWTASIPNTDSSIFAGKKLKLEVASVMLGSDEKAQGRLAAKFGYSGRLVWDAGGQESSQKFVQEDWDVGPSVVVWEYMSPGANQFLENITLRIYGSNYEFALDWGPQISKPGSTFSTLEFYGSIQNIETDQRQEFDPQNMIKLTRTASAVPAITAVKPGTGTPTSVKPATPTSKPPMTTSRVQGTIDVWSDVPIYPNVAEVPDSAVKLADESFSQLEWRYFGTADGVSKVVDFYKKQMLNKGWTLEMWAESPVMPYGSYQKNNETRRCLVYIIGGDGETAIQLMSASK
jgi:hypothetical protein